MTQQTRTDAIYARQSIDKADSISIESQIEFCRYETRGAPCQVFADRGYSGKNTDRPEFQKMLALIRAGRIRRVICYKLDRCSRSILDFTTLMAEFQQYGVEFVSCTEKFDTSTPMGRAMLNICIVFAQLERETIQQRVSDAYHSRSAKGFYMGGKVPFGFCRESCTLEGKRTSRFREEPKEAQILRLLYETYARTSVSLGDLVELLKEKGIANPRRSDGRWVRSHIGRMLANPVYVRADMALYQYYKEKGVAICSDPADFTGINGCYLYSGKESGQCLVIAPHTGLISSQLWLKCRQKHTKHPRKENTDTTSWLTGRLLCEKCGHRLAFSSSGGKNSKHYCYLVCPHAHGANRICDGLHGWKRERAEKILSSQLKKHLKTHYSVLIPPSNAETNAREITIAQIQCEIEKAAAKAPDTSGPLLACLNTHIQQLEMKKEALLQQGRKGTSAERIYPDYDKCWESLTSQEKTLVLDSLVHRITLSENRIAITWRLAPSANCTFR